MMLRKDSFLFLGLLVILPTPGSAATLAYVDLSNIPQVQPGGSQECCRNVQNFSDYFQLLVTGGTGTGFVLLDVRMLATTDQQPGLHPSYAYSTGNELQVDGWPQPIDNPGNQCNYGPLCSPMIPVPFTFGVPEVIHLSGSVYVNFSAEIGTDLSQQIGPLVGQTIQSYINFYGAAGFVDSNGLGVRYPDAQVTLTSGNNDAGNGVITVEGDSTAGGASLRSLLASDPLSAVPEPGEAWLGAALILAMALMNHYRAGRNSFAAGGRTTGRDRRRG